MDPTPSSMVYYFFCVRLGEKRLDLISFEYGFGFPHKALSKDEWKTWHFSTSSPNPHIGPKRPTCPSECFHPWWCLLQSHWAWSFWDLPEDTNAPSKPRLIWLTKQDHWREKRNHPAQQLLIIDVTSVIDVDLCKAHQQRIRKWLHHLSRSMPPVVRRKNLYQDGDHSTTCHGRKTRTPLLFHQLAGWQGLVLLSTKRGDRPPEAPHMTVIIPLTWTLGTRCIVVWNTCSCFKGSSKGDQ